ncbi:2-succinyl-5-enolpyruvyl-6-hydroxy-3-cyclohexene-1-carboxylate synthase [Heyndrickxia shackletonii]|uniref:2-succinyl-5-enolpyruvyl-6-hydroxy-3-cyclohexene-1-carboxylate synthase n=1 Tax=Heyndrickxia shackletonii TaxID=157838 RepID=A0A0Q3WWY7_9BACI|nr:2-succinyl-5-enolpyruvyl-6-hydroxy-3-cyclohexene-1-carboxylic-acid synthase [Heyndrickxia shackletonii]KQL53223.1 2-succinyl-5-enolpyruvyl-6-hydroxy-3-cyclohexene-1-carboxylate synthase [Heyndrickxia shackletonii]MBB2480866.1 2-succinyl-5-enolpyruvyl-6-hydroxy-3-cyclohexene-1-carboxylic-acid synthase [Bacillus sp. APMAM]NEZ01835.1 2-succinyl-5-enolpyruvyl-6-hydroxy-3-cyclohexene-1-carboxylic-acid synthase [Heyndrickxia shackletonii]RTZ55724.1 2-succinyl-5-enolpyruvyl-6-hydroxy-3-cyclohexene-
MNEQEILTSFLADFIQELVFNGVKDVVISPGSRSTPLAMMIAEHPDLAYHINIDERSAAFFALGMAKQTRKPVALLCTSGTAAANYYPAIVEAKISRVPLIVLTADRPHELRDIGAPQSIDQINLYGKHVKWFVEMSIPDPNEELHYFVRTTAARAVNLSLQAPAGPVHLNFPFREPLIPRLEPSPFEETKQSVKSSQGKLILSNGELERICMDLETQPKGLIICGVIDEPDFAQAVLTLSERLGYPIIADPLSQLRSGLHSSEAIIDNYDSFLKDGKYEEKLSPEVIIRFGAMPVSKPLTLFLKKLKKVDHYIIDSGSGWRDPIKMGTQMIHADEILFCEGISSRIKNEPNNKWLQIWQQLNRNTRKIVTKTIEDVQELDEGRVVLELTKLLPNNSTLFVGNSMPIRDVDTFFHNNQKNIRVMANRGANGIDGVVSSAIGASVYGENLFLIIGDLSFFHDLNGLLAAKMHHLNITIIVINNNGGGIFSFLPQASSSKNFENLFGTPIDVEFEYAVKMYGGNYKKVTNWNEFQSSINRAIETSGLNVIEVPTNREKNVQTHRNMWNHVSQEKSKLLTGDTLC